MTNYLLHFLIFIADHIFEIGITLCPSVRPYARPSIRHIFMCICWQITLKGWQKISHAEVSRWLSRPTSMPMGTVVISCVLPCVEPSLGLVWVLWIHHLQDMAYNLAVLGIQMTYLRLPSTLIGIIVRPPFWVWVCWGWGWGRCTGGLSLLLGIAVAISGEYGGYLLSLMAVLSSSEYDNDGLEN